MANPHDDIITNLSVCVCMCVRVFFVQDRYTDSQMDTVTRRIDRRKRETWRGEKSRGGGEGQRDYTAGCWGGDGRDEWHCGVRRDNRAKRLLPGDLDTLTWHWASAQGERKGERRRAREKEPRAQLQQRSSMAQAALQIPP